MSEHDEEIKEIEEAMEVFRGPYDKPPAQYFHAGRTIQRAYRTAIQARDQAIKERDELKQEVESMRDQNEKNDGEAVSAYREKLDEIDSLRKERDELKDKYVSLEKVATEWEKEARDFPKLKCELETEKAMRDCAMEWLKILRPVVAEAAANVNRGDTARAALEKVGTLINLYPRTQTIIQRSEQAEARLKESEAGAGALRRALQIVIEDKDMLLAYDEADHEKVLAPFKKAISSTAGRELLTAHEELGRRAEQAESLNSDLRKRVEGLEKALSIAVPCRDCRIHGYGICASCRSALAALEEPKTKEGEL